VNACFRATILNDGHLIDSRTSPGACATGSELAAALHNTIRVLAA